LLGSMPCLMMERIDKELLRAARDGDLGKVKEILSLKKDALNCMNERGQTPLHLASRNHHAEVVQEMIKNGADLNVPDNRGRTPLHAAMSLELCIDPENLQVVKLLVDNGADLGKQDLEGVTPVHQASRNGRVHVLQWLLDQHPHGYLPSTYLPRDGRAGAPRDAHACESVLACAFAWLYPAAEAVASVACCLPLWQSTPPLVGEENR